MLGQDRDKAETQLLRFGWKQHHKGWYNKTFGGWLYPFWRAYNLEFANLEAMHNTLTRAGVVYSGMKELKEKFGAYTASQVKGLRRVPNNNHLTAC